MESIAVYIHWPYCLKKCPYCDFNSHVGRDIDHKAWRDAYGREIEYYAKILGKREVTSVFFGGGTPSLMEPQTLQHVLESLAGRWNFAKACEITIEANPTSIEAEKFTAFKQAGVNRVSVGVQSLRDEQLRFLGREHSAKEALKALDIAGSVFDRMSFDLIYARPGQTIDEWRAELGEALKYARGHMSLYQLTIENGTQFKTLRDSGRLTELDGDIAADMYAVTQQMLNDAGLPAYEISNHAATGQESRHNLTYWHYRDYIGIGPGAHGRITLPEGRHMATRTHKAPDIWMQNVSEYGHGAKPFENLDVKTRAEERLMMGLRLRGGIEIGDMAFDKEMLKPLLDNDMLLIDAGRLFVPVQFWPILDSILAKILLSMK